MPENIRAEVQPVSNCHPKLYPGTDKDTINFETPAYKSYTSQPYLKNWFAEYSVVADKPCRYRLTLSDLDYPNVHHNSITHLSLPEESAPNHMYTHTVLLTYPYYQTVPFTVKVKGNTLNRAI